MNKKLKKRILGPFFVREGIGQMHKEWPAMLKIVDA